MIFFILSLVQLCLVTASLITFLYFFFKIKKIYDVEKSNQPNPCLDIIVVSLLMFCLLLLILHSVVTPVALTEGWIGVALTI